MKSFKSIISTGLLSMPLALTACKMDSSNPSSTAIRKAKVAQTKTADTAEETLTTDNIDTPTSEQEADVATSSETTETPTVETEQAPTVSEQIETDASDTHQEAKVSAEKTTQSTQSTSDIKQCLKDLCEIPGEISLKIFIQNQKKISDASKEYLNKNFKEKISKTLETYSKEGEAYSEVIKKFQAEFGKTKLNEKQLRALKFLSAISTNQTDKSQMEKIMLTHKNTDFIKAYSEKVSTKLSSLTYFIKLQKNTKSKLAIQAEAQQVIKLIKSINTTVGAPILGINKPLLTRALNQDTLDTNSLTELMNVSFMTRLLNTVITAEADSTQHIALSEKVLITKISGEIHNKYADRRKNMAKSLESCSISLMQGIQIYGAESQILAMEANSYAVIKQAADSLEDGNVLKNRISQIKILSPLSREKYTTLFSKYLNDLDVQGNENINSVKNFSEPEALTLAVAKSLLQEKNSISCENTLDDGTTMLEMIDDEYLKLSWITSHASNVGISTTAISQLLGEMLYEQPKFSEKHKQCLASSGLNAEQMKSDTTYHFATELLEKLSKQTGNTKVNLGCSLLTLSSDNEVSSETGIQDVLGALRIHQAQGKEIPASCQNLQQKIEFSKALSCK